MINIFSAFGIVREIFKPTEGKFNFVNLIPSLILITLQYFMKLIVVFSTSKTTAEANETSVIVARIMNECDDVETYNCKKFLLQIQTRNLNIQNVFFVINWSLLLMVKFKGCELTTSFWLYFVSDDFNCCHISCHHMPVWRAVSLKSIIITNGSSLNSNLSKHFIWYSYVTKYTWKSFHRFSFFLNFVESFWRFSSKLWKFSHNQNIGNKAVWLFSQLLHLSSLFVWHFTSLNVEVTSEVTRQFW